ncbi:MAG: hypothetical protein AVDCRST_MAG87-3647 [uncultured Thermomicrobiales bacterium]|uniref:Transglycosylase SLT domain-containing protein n=1 Tax=uncultured Thermomicrobiales bacterium TaxID=1645740 RepID=A0A6J4VMQ8_9BACT|nr:MAG: hypothetical protein AVDCRST_MAG87-3647 [uncultured Thermomicrobiales bacterium]
MSPLPFRVTGAGPGLFRAVSIVTLIMLLFGGFIAISPAAHAASTRTTDNLNLRAGPALNAPILDVMVAGERVETTGEPVNGFYPVIFEGVAGFAYGDYLTIGGSGSGLVTGGGPVGEVNVVDGPVNFRSGPSTNDAVISVIPDGGLVALTGDSANGFSSIVYTDRSGWAHTASILGGSDTVSAPVDAPAPSPAAPRNGAGSGDIVSIIYAAADAYGQSRADMLRVATCESNLVPTAVNPSSNASGLFQFMPSTFASTPYAGQNIFDPVASANAAGWMWANGRRGEWECQ